MGSKPQNDLKTHGGRGREVEREREPKKKENHIPTHINRTVIMCYHYSHYIIIYIFLIYIYMCVYVCFCDWMFMSWLNQLVFVLRSGCVGAVCFPTSGPASQA